jgi:predicted amidohydrolase
VGKDENGIIYNGHSAIYGPKGEEFGVIEDTEQILTITLEKQPLDDFREKVPIYLDADNFNLNIC